MPSTRKQKAREKRSRQSDVMSDIENLDVMLGNYQEDDQVRDEDISNIDFDLESRRPQREINSFSGNFRSILNTNVGENSEITVETSRAINSEISSQMSRKLEEMRSDLNSHILNAIDSAIEEKVTPSIRNALESQNSTKNTNTDLRSAGPHPSTFGQVRPQRDLRSVGPQQQIAGKASQDAKKDFLRLVTMSSNQINHQREDSVNFCGSDDENGYDMVTGDNLTPQMVTEFLTGRPMQSQNKIPHQQCVNDDTLDTTIPAQIPPVPTNNRDVPFEAPIDSINRLADVIMEMNNKPLAQTLMVRPVFTTTLTFDGKSEKFGLFEDLFHTMIKMQPDMTETMKINHFHSLLRKNALQTFRNINSANRQTLEDILAVFRRKYVKPESQATAKHKWHKLVFDPNTMKMLDFLEELNQGAEKPLGNMPKQRLTVCFMASFRLALTQMSIATIAKNRGMSKMTAENSRERRNKSAMAGRIPRKNIPNVQLATKPITRRNGVGKALEPTSSSKTSNWIIPKPRKLPWFKMTPITNLLLPFSKTQKTRCATTPL